MENPRIEGKWEKLNGIILLASYQIHLYLLWAKDILMYLNYAIASNLWNKVQVPTLSKQCK